MRAACLFMLACAGCSQGVDPCAGVAGNCITIEVGGATSPLDELTVSATQLPGRTVVGHASIASGLFALPVQFAAVLPDDFTGAIDLELLGTRNGQPLGEGSAGITLPPAG